MKKRVEKKLTRYERAAVLHYVMALVFFVTVFMQVVSLSFRAAILPLILGAASLVIGTIYLYCDKKKLEKKCWGRVDGSSFLNGAIMKCGQKDNDPDGH
ncbi:MAG: hypothetical protein LKE61_12220 [Erysipelotrichaceae bacterium]|jgi:hypothetical protein|nr:hypothetical protein [Erysipelotrichaceae bacterium]MCI1326018.1 hypothetical protein [Solobacterium sp.]MCH4043365.1 hypothetical protein [Erysipelotrichaceae bacterium]MCH4120588.1 hypothetical protein [Erysipelotrichaceae bacterium]MCI1362740.1 hypothetical protein [Solobacterium sp.]